jgi:glycosyltransferase involved in cell wall biosynthesis
MKILTTNASGKDVFGGIHTHLHEHIIHSPGYSFHIIELNRERRYVSEENKIIRKFDLPSLIGSEDIRDIITKSSCFDEFKDKGNKVINEYQNAIQIVNPDRILIFGTSIPSFFLYSAAKREGLLSKTIHSYAGVLEKEIGGYDENSQNLLKEVGRSFTADDSIEDVTYIFPSNLCKNTVEKIHNVLIPHFHIIPNGVSNHFFNESISRIPPKELSLGYIGRLAAVKNVDLFLGLKDIFPEFKLKIITDIAAGAHKPIGKMLLRKMTDGEVFYFHPRRSEELVSFYKTELSANIVPSSFETFCNVATESIVCGTPTLLSDRAGSVELFQKWGLEKLVFSIDNLDSLRNALEYIKENNFQIDKNLCKEIYSQLSWENIINKYNDVIESISSQ